MVHSGLTLLTVLLLFCLKTFPQSSEQKTNSFLIIGHLKGRDTGIITLLHPTMGQYKRDTALINKGRFQFTGSISEPSFCWLRGSDTDGNSVNFFLESGKQYIFLEENKFDNFNMSGSFTQKQDDTLGRKIKAIEFKYKKWINEYTELADELSKLNDSVSKLKVQEKISKVAERNVVIEKEYINTKVLFISQHPDSYVSPTYLYSLMLNQQITTDSVKILSAKFLSKIKNSRGGKLIREELNKRELNIKAADFTIKNIESVDISLSDYRGKYVLINFWASWCIPCIEKIPDLKRLSNTYYNKGFEILNISIDNKRESWVQAVKKYDVQQFCNVLANDDIEKKYPNTKQPIPSEILIDRKGIIIWNSLNQSSKSLEDVLKEEFEE